MVAELTVLNNKEDAYGGTSFSPSGCNPSGRCGNGLEKIYPTCAVRYGYMRYIGEFSYSPGMLFNCGAKVVIQSMRGIEIGEQVSLTCSGCDKSVSRDQMLSYVKNSGQDFMKLKSGKVLRPATTQDLDEERHLKNAADQKLIDARKLSKDMNLTMKFVACEHLLGGERIIFHFMSEERVDFREFVKNLAQEYHTRIEMHQVGAREEARLVADYEICGRECCCKNFLKKTHRINMRMAKLQKSSLDPTKVSGRCGRLRCCLRYEHEGYEELNSKLPRVAERVRTEQGTATVKDRQILTQLLTVLYDQSAEAETIAIEEVLERNVTDPPATDAKTTKAAGGHDQGRVTSTRQKREPQSPAKQDVSRIERKAKHDSGPRSSEVSPQERRGDDSTPLTDDNRSASDSEGSPQKRKRRRRGRRRRRRGSGSPEGNSGSPDQAGGDGSG